MICKTEKSAMIKILRNDSALPNHIDVVIVDGFFLIHSMKDVPQSFGNISKKILQILASYNASCVHVVFDRYWSPSIKDYERSLRGGSDSTHEYVISGPDQARTHDFAKELRNDRFKEALVRFLISHWQSNDVAAFIGNKTISLNFINCYSFSVVNGNVVKTEKLDFFCSSHEEADTKIIYHASKINSGSTVVVKCSDTDIVIIMLGNLHKIKAKIYIECGVSRSRHIINVNALHELLGLDLCKALPGFHAFTGCDYNPAFFKKGKKRPFQILAKNEEFQQAFASLGDTGIDIDNTFAKIEAFVCSMYGYETQKKINNVRYLMFLRNYKVKNTDEAFLKANLKSFDASCLPPCYTELLQQMRRAHYIAHLWNKATLRDPIEFEPETSGWTLTNSKYEFLWFEGPQLPPSVKDVILDNQDSEGNF